MFACSWLFRLFGHTTDVAQSRDRHAHPLRSGRGQRARRTSLDACSLRSEALTVTAAPSPDLGRENAYLRQRNAQLEEDVLALAAEAERLRQIVERLHGRTAARPPNPLGGGQ